MGLGQMCVCVSFLNMQMLKGLSAVKATGWRVAKTALGTAVWGEGRDVPLAGCALSSQQVLFSRSFGAWVTDCSCHGAHITKPCIMNVSVS